jgi:hypothetical protein
MNRVIHYRPPDEVSFFILRRAVRYGSVTRRDVIDAFGKIGTTKASLAMDGAVLHWPETLERTGKAVRVRPNAPIPPQASETQLMSCLEHGLLSPRDTGLRQSELPVSIVQWTQNIPQKPGILLTLTQAIVHQQGLRIFYVGLRRDESPRWRWLLPAGLERMGDQWRLIAQDLEDISYPIKVFVLPRIRDADISEQKLPKDLIRLAADDRIVELAVKLNPKLSAEQADVLQHELRVENGKVKLPKRGIFEFLRRYSDQGVNSNAVWPPLFKDE